MSSTDPVRMNPQAIAIIPAPRRFERCTGEEPSPSRRRSLVERAVDGCRAAARLVHTIYVSTDDVEIAARAELRARK